MDQAESMVRTPPSKRWVASRLPWTNGAGRPWRGWRQLPLMVPFVPIHLIVAWILFVPAAEYRNGNYWIDQDAVEHLLFEIPDLTARPLGAIRSIITAPWLNHDAIQLGYVTALLLLFGAIFELREGTIRMLAMFFGTTFVAAIGGGFLLHLIYPQVWDTTFFETAWNRTWSGGSAGCFGIMGAIAARAQRPALLLGVFIAWECFIWWVNLRNYTSVFHFTAMSTGFVVARWLLPPARRVTT